jgi:hypothetical protein
VVVEKMTEMSITNNEAGGVDLFIGRDSGNTFRVLTGGKRWSLETWNRLRDLCDEAIRRLE